MSLANRKQCLWDLKEIGYQVGCGFMVGSPGQTVETLYEDLQFIKELEPHMVGIGPFISQKDTPSKVTEEMRKDQEEESVCINQYSFDVRA